MATQLKSDELNGCKSYFEWLCEWIIPEGHRYIMVNRESGKKIFTKLLLNDIDKEKIAGENNNQDNNKNNDKNNSKDNLGMKGAVIPSGD